MLTSEDMNSMSGDKPYHKFLKNCFEVYMSRENEVHVSKQKALSLETDLPSFLILASMFSCLKTWNEAKDI